MKVLFRSRDFASINGGGFGFNHMRPLASSWHYQGRVQHPAWQGTFTCQWDGPEVLWTVQGDERLFGLAAVLKSKGLKVEVMQDEDAEMSGEPRYASGETQGEQHHGEKR